MIQAIRQLGEDFLAAILFFAVYAVTGSLYLAVGVAIAAGLANILRRQLAARPVAAMQWLSLGLVIVLGAGTLLLHTPRLFMLKPSLVHAAVAVLMLRRGWMRPYLPPVVRENVPETAIVRAGYAWAGLLAVLALVNLVIALKFSLAVWAWFISAGAVGAKILAFAVQYVAFRSLVRRRLAHPPATA
jgi:intracellular septation protein